MSPFSIAFITDGEAFHGGSPEEQALGGSETALVQVARALARRGHRVVVFCRCPKPGLYDAVLYRDRKDLVRAAIEERYEVLIVSRFFSALDLPLQAGLRILWNHDILDQPSLLAERLERLDLAFVLSGFHAKGYKDRLPQCEAKLHQTRNGLDLDLMDQATARVARVPGRVTYVSRPERGLKQLLEYIWPRLKERMPHLELKLCGYQVDATQLHPSIKAEYAYIDELIANSPDVEVLGGLAKGEYYRHLASCQAMLYPSVFPEISCIAALEAQALGLPVITSDAFALSETVVEEHFKVGGEPGSDAYLTAYVNRACDLLQNPGPTGVLAARAREKVRSRYSWHQIAAEWEELFAELFRQRKAKQARAVAANLLLSGDALAAEGLLGRSLAHLDKAPAPEDPEEAELLEAIAHMAKQALTGAGESPKIGLLSAAAESTNPQLSALMAGHDLEIIDPHAQSCAAYDLVIIRDMLERHRHPEQLLDCILPRCKPQGWLLLCTASGAWPLVAPGYLGRRHDLAKDDLNSLLPDRKIRFEYLPRGRVRSGAETYAAGRWLALAPVKGPRPGALDMGSKDRRVRAATQEVIASLEQNGVL